MFLDVNHYSKLNLSYNPFSFLNNQELFDVTYERINLDTLTNSIKDKSSFFVEFYGKKGRGKSTLVQTLHAKYLPEASFIQLKKKEKNHISITSNILIIDSFQLLTVKNKLELLNQQKRLIICSHYSHNVFNFLNRNINQRINFNKLSFNETILEKIINKRIKLACLDVNKPLPKFKKNYIKELVGKHGNDLRSIQLALYDFFLQPKKEYYEL